MKRILLLISVFGNLAMANTFIGNGGQAGDLELAVSLKQINGALERIRLLKTEDPNRRFCVCPEAFLDHNLCGTVQKLNESQQQHCEKFVQTQLNKLERAAKETQFEWVKTEMVNRDSVGDRIVDAVARKDKNMIYIDQSRFLSLDESKRMFLITHELFHMDTFDGIKLDDEDKIGPFTHEYGVRDLLNAAAASITLTSLDETIFQDYTKYLKQSRSTSRHWIGLLSQAASVHDDKNTNFSVDIAQGSRWTYQYQFESLYNLGLTVHLGAGSGEKMIFSTVNLKQKQSVTAVGVTWRYFLFNNMDPFSHFWNTFVQIELLHENYRGSFDMYENPNLISSSASSQAMAIRVNLFLPMKHGFWFNSGIHFSQHELYFKEFDYKLTSKSPNFFLGVSYGF